MIENIKPPLGLTPRRISQRIYLESRQTEIEEAIARYKKAKFEIPADWDKELLDVVKILKFIYKDNSRMYIADGAKYTNVGIKGEDN
jgi:hypothetical protein